MPTLTITFRFPHYLSPEIRSQIESLIPPRLHTYPDPYSALGPIHESPRHLEWDLSDFPDPPEAPPPEMPSGEMMVGRLHFGLAVGSGTVLEDRGVRLGSYELRVALDPDDLLGSQGKDRRQTLATYYREAPPLWLKASIPLLNALAIPEGNEALASAILEWLGQRRRNKTFWAQTPQEQLRLILQTFTIPQPQE